MTAATEPADSDPQTATAPLRGLTVVDFTRVLAGPFATMLMADLGARVIKVERPATAEHPGGDDSRRYGPFAPDGRSMYFARVNRGKQSIALDLKRDRDAARLLAGQADVVVENFRPTVMDRLGLGYQALSAHNPGLVYASISGYGATGPRAGQPAYDAVIQARSGLMSITGEGDGPPTKAGISLSDLSAGLYAFGAVMAALVGRGIRGRGTYVDVSMFDATVSMLEGAALAYLADRTVPHRIGNHHFHITPFGTFQAADEPLVICAGNDTLYTTLATAIGRQDLATRPDYATNDLRTEHRDALTADLETTLGEHPAAHWLTVLDAAGVPAAPVNDIAAALDDPQTLARRMRIDVAGLELPGQVIKLTGYPDPHTRPAAPELDEHGESIRTEFGLPPAAPTEAPTRTPTRTES